MGVCGRSEKGLWEVTQADHWDGRLVMLRKDSGVSFRAVRKSQAPEEKDTVVWFLNTSDCVILSNLPYPCVNG